MERARRSVSCVIRPSSGEDVSAKLRREGMAHNLVGMLCSSQNFLSMKEDVAPESIRTSQDNVDESRKIWAGYVLRDPFWVKNKDCGSGCGGTSLN